MSSSISLQSLANGVEWLTGTGGVVTLATGRHLHIYLRGTTTQVQVYSDAGLTVPVSQPLVTDSNGVVPGYIAAEQAIDFYDDVSGQRGQGEALSAADVTAAQTAETARAEAAESLLIPLSQKGVANGVGTLDGTGRQPIGQAPLSVANVAAREFNVKTYGAVGNGATNDTAAVQAALNACNAAGGGLVFFPDGNYLVGALTVYSDTTLMGTAYDLNYTGRGSRLTLAAATNASMLTVGWGAGNVFVHNLHLEGSTAGQTATSHGIYFHEDPANTGPQNYQQSLVFHCSVKGFHDNGVYIGKWNGAVFVDQCFVANNGGHGVLCETSDCAITNSQILSNTGDGVRLGNSTCTVAGNSSISGNLRGVAIVSGGGGSSQSSGTAIKNHKIYGNQIDKSQQEGIYVQALDTVIFGNTIGGNSLAGNSSYSNINVNGTLTDASNAFGISVLGNTFEDAFGSGTKPAYHIAVSNYALPGMGLINEGGNSFDPAGRNAANVSDSSAFQYAAVGALSAPHFTSTQPAAPTIVANAADGTTPPAPTIQSWSTDSRGQCFLGSGAAPTAGVLATVTFAQPYRAQAPVVVLVPGNAATAALMASSQIYATPSTTTFQIVCGVAPAASQAVGTWNFFYWVIG